MSNIKGESSYQIEYTADGSPTLRLEGAEPMHSLEGALSESLYIYGPTIDFALCQADAKIFSLGLGLGYNEMIAAAALSGRTGEWPWIYSSESLTWLKKSFQQWIENQSSPLSRVYESMAEGISKRFSIAPEILKDNLVKLHKMQKLVFLGPLNQSLSLPDRFHGILYDAFSLKTTPQLWTPDFLDFFLKTYACDTCAFSTYAATGNLKRALTKNQFKIEQKAGFGKKRESTFALREDL